MFLEPPTFEEATNFGERFIDIDQDEHNRTDDFIPRYPMYTNFAMPSAPPQPLKSSVPINQYPFCHYLMIPLPHWSVKTILTVQHNRTVGTLTHKKEDIIS